MVVIDQYRIAAENLLAVNGNLHFATVSGSASALDVFSDGGMNCPAKEILQCSLASRVRPEFGRDTMLLW